MPPRARSTVAWEIAAVVVALLGAAAWFQPEVSGDDLWWLLAAGRQIVETASIPMVDSFSFTFAGRPWMNHEWLWSAVYWLLYSIRVDAVAWFNLGVLLAVFGLVYAVARKESGSPLAAGLSVWAAAATAHWFLDVRPHLFTLAFLALLLLTHRRPWAPWLWPLLVLVWVNTHGGFVFGLGAIGLIALLCGIEESFATGRPVLTGRPWIGVALSLLAALVNPWGWHIVEYPLAYLERSSVFRGISEWLPPGFGLDPQTFHGRFWWLALSSLPGLLVAIRRARLLVVLWGVLFAMAFTSRRFIPLFAVVAAPLLAMALAWVFAHLRTRMIWWNGTTARVLTTAVGAGIALLLWSDVRLSPRPLDRWTLSALQPRAGLDYLRTIGPPGRPFHDLNWGGFITLRAPEIPVFIDGRANTLYDAEVARDYLTLDRAGPGFEEVLERWRIDALLVEVRHPLLRGLREAKAPWRVVYRDAISAVLLPLASPLLRKPMPAPVRDAPEVLVLESQRWSRQDRPAEARRSAERAIEQDPLFFLAYRELAVAYAMEGDEAGLQSAIAAGIAAYPRGVRRFHAFEGVAWEQVGNVERALRAYRSAVSRGPFGSDPAVDARIRALENR